MTAGIYAINHIPTGMKYIGSSVCIKKRVKDHKRLLDAGVHHCKKLQLAWDKYGCKAFEFYQVEKIADKGILFKREQFWIDFFDIEKCGFNTMLIAGVSPWGPEATKFISAAKRVKKYTWQEVEAINKAKLRRDRALVAKEIRAKRSIETYIKKLGLTA